MSELPSEIESILIHHIEFCTLSVERCRDCLFAHDKRARSALTIAREEIKYVQSWINSNPFTCVYCGEEAEELDHLVPRPWTGNEIRKFVPVVPACRDCNLRISDAPIFTIVERARIVSTSLRKKYRKTIDIPDITEKEFLEFGRNLQDKLRSAQILRQHIRARIRVLDSGGASVVASPSEAQEFQTQNYQSQAPLASTDHTAPSPVISEPLTRGDGWGLKFD